MRDLYKKGGGASRLTLRRFLVLVEGLDRFTSRFWAHLDKRENLSAEACLTADIFAVHTGERHPIVTRLEDEQRRRSFEERKARALAAEKRRQKMMKQ